MIHQNKSDHLEKELRRELERMPEGEQLRSVRRIMADYNVSQLVVNQALDNLERSGWIIRRARRGIFRYGVGGNRKLHIAMIAPDWESPVYNELENQLNNQCDTEEMIVQRFVFPVFPNGLFHYLPVREFDIILVVSAPLLQMQDIDQIIHCPVPILFLGASFPGIALNYIDANPTKNGMIAADFLIRRGYRRPAILYHEPHIANHDERAEGFQLTAASHNIPVTVLDTHTAIGSSSTACALGCVQELLTAGKFDFDSLYLIADSAYPALSHLFATHSVKIPEDIGILGSDGNECGLYAPIPLTTVGIGYPNYIATVYKAIDRLVNDRNDLVQIVMTPQIIERSSVRTKTKE
ncbi:MAG: substrate-binding domain-containing protein [Victivallaceae bacterium]|nr:substrate-binding domain-containing protein [Victivallaceae bacterium]